MNKLLCILILLIGATYAVEALPREVESIKSPDGILEELPPLLPVVSTTEAASSEADASEATPPAPAEPSSPAPEPTVEESSEGDATVATPPVIVPSSPAPVPSSPAPVPSSPAPVPTVEESSEAESTVPASTPAPEPSVEESSEANSTVTSPPVEPTPNEPAETTEEPSVEESSEASTEPAPPKLSCVGDCPIADPLLGRYLPHGNCSLFCQCSYGQANVIPCPKGLQFNPVALVCDWPVLANCSGVGGVVLI